MTTSASLKITEAGGKRIILPETKGSNKYKVRMMGWQPGSDTVEGSSADYPVSVIKRDFPEAFPAGTRLRANHDGICESGGDVRRIMAKTADTPWVEADGMYTHIMVPEQYVPFIENFGDVIGLSISAGCEVQMEALRDDQGDVILDHEDQPTMVPSKSARGAQIVSSFMSAEKSPYNSLDFVEAPGADGRIVARAVESAKQVLEHFTIREAATFARGTRKTEASEAAPPRINKNKENSMTDEEIQALAEDAANRAVTKTLEALKAGEPKPTEHKLSDTVETVLEAGLSKRGRAAVIERIERGDDVAKAVSEQKAFEDDIKAEFGAGVKPVVESVDQEPIGFGVTHSEGTAKVGASDTKAVNEAFAALVSDEELI